MTRLPGTTLFGSLWEWFTPEERQTATQQQKDILGFIRCWSRHSSAKSALIRSIVGTSIRSNRVPFCSMTPCSDQSELNRRLIEPADSSIDDSESRRACVDQLDSTRHDIVFTHGDIAPHNIRVLHDGRIGRLIDWEAAGYYPEYWEYTTGYGVAKQGWWFDLVRELAGGNYTKEHRGDLARWVLTNGTMI